MATISIVVPTYNQSKYLEKCIKSILQQTKRPDEIIIVDDCSTDNTPEIVKPYIKQLTYTRNATNQGPVETYNRGLRKASGDYILMVSGDDFLEKQILEKESAILDKHFQIGMVYAQAKTLQNGKIFLRVASPAGKTSYIGRKYDYELFLTDGGNFVPYMTAMARGVVYKKVGLYDANLNLLADLDMWARIAKSYPLAYIAKPLAYYRIHGQNLSYKINNPQNFKKEFYYILKKHFSNSKLDNQSSKLKHSAYHYYYKSLALNETQNSNFKKAKKLWTKSLKLKQTFSIGDLQTIYLAIKSLFIGLSKNGKKV